VSSILSSVNVPVALAAPSAAEAIRQGAANIPGYGQPDIYYPPNFEGTWKVTQIPGGESGLSPAPAPYQVRYVRQENGKVIADRAYNEANRLKAPKQEEALSTGGEGEPTSPSNSVRSISWEPSNPNVLTTIFGDGRAREVKVTKRSVEIGPPTPFGDDQHNSYMLGTMLTSEFRRVTDVDAFRGIPSISGERLLSKWKWTTDQPDRIDGIELLYNDGGMMGDPMAASPGKTMGGSPKTTTPPVKKRLALERIKQV
jgi:hypothetical protein